MRTMQNRNTQKVRPKKKTEARPWATVMAGMDNL